MNYHFYAIAILSVDKKMQLAKQVFSMKVE
jgi:hypothetical protein